MRKQDDRDVQRHRADCFIACLSLVPNQFDDFSRRWRSQQFVSQPEEATSGRRRTDPEFLRGPRPKLHRDQLEVLDLLLVSPAKY